MKPSNLPTKPYISIGIPTYEAGESLAVTLQSIYTQTAFELVKEVLISVDGNSIDAQLAKKIAHPKLKIVESKKREGQSARLNDLFRLATSELLILTNDDVVLDSKAVSEISREFIDNASDLISGRAFPFEGKSLLESVLSVSYELNHTLIDVLPNRSYLSCNGRLIALSRKFYQAVSIPESVWNNDAYIYFVSKMGAFSYSHVPTAKVFFQSPTALDEHIKQSRKFQVSQKENQRYFKESLAIEYITPKSAIFKAMLITFIGHPLLIPAYFGVLVYSRLFPQQSVPHSGTWETDTTTKNLSHSTLTSKEA